MPEWLTIVLVVLVVVVGIAASRWIVERGRRMRESARATAALESEIRRGAVQPRTLLDALIPNGRPILLAIDASGSMVHTFKALIDQWIEEFSDCEGVDLIAFDWQVLPIDPFPVGGGTNYAAVMEYVENLPVHPRVIVLTDGIADRITPAHPDLWMWALTHAPFPKMRDRTVGSMIHFSVAQEVRQ